MEIYSHLKLITAVVMGRPLVLEPITEAAKAHHGPNGCNIILDQTEMHIGRNPAVQPGNVNLPIHWAQVSAKHCIVSISDGQVGFDGKSVPNVIYCSHYSR